MTRRFDFETSLGETLKVELSVWCHDREGDYGYEDVSLMNAAGELVAEESLLPQDRVRFEAKCEDVAYDAADDAYQSYAEGMGDWLYECARDEA